MKKSFLVFGVLGALLATNGYAVENVAEETSDVVSVARAAKLDKTRVTNQDTIQDTNVLIDKIVEEAAGGISVVQCGKCCRVEWKGNTYSCAPKPIPRCQNATCDKARKTGWEQQEMAPSGRIVVEEI